MYTNAQLNQGRWQFFSSFEGIYIVSGFAHYFILLQGGFKITPAGYAHMTHMLCSLGKGKLIMALEVSMTAIALYTNVLLTCLYLTNDFAQPCLNW